jgi:hypothetical protein
MDSGKTEIPRLLAGNGKEGLPLTTLIIGALKASIFQSVLRIKAYKI